jgi:phosphoglycolate phosphatase
MKHYQLAVFDWDGTLMDSTGTIVSCIQQAIAELCLAPRTDRQVMNIIGLGLEEAVHTLYPDASQSLIQDLASSYRRFFFDHPVSHEYLFPDVTTLLQTLTEHEVKLAVATGKSRRGLDKVLQETGTAHYFCSTRAADETQSKPNPQMLSEILEETNTPASKAVMIGDTEYDMAMAEALGVDRVAVSYGAHEVERLHRYQPVQVFDSVGQMLAWTHTC